MLGVTDNPTQLLSYKLSISSFDFSAKTWFCKPPLKHHLQLLPSILNLFIYYCSPFQLLHSPLPPPTNMMSVETDDDMMSYTTSQPEMSPCLPASILAERVSWDVFLSFKADGTCIAASIHDALVSKGLRPFSNTIQQNLDDVMKDSALAVIIISPNYAASHECLKELSSIYKLYNKDSKKWDKRVIPVFYEVDPSHVRKQNGVFGNGFQELLKQADRFSKDEIAMWKGAFEAVGNISGYTCPIERVVGNEAEVVQLLVQQVWSEVKNTPEYVVKLDVGLDYRVDHVVNLLDVQQKDSVRFLNIHGTPGIGKTTLAKAVYNKLAADFSKRCFISKVRAKLMQKPQEEGILNIQNEIINGLSLGNAKSVDDGKTTIKRIICQNRVLLVLDDVFDANHFDDIGIRREWFDGGSRIIITSRNENALLELAHSNELYEAEKLNSSESLELFSIHALGRREPTPDFQVISKKIVSLIGGLPLALEVFGSLLVKKTIKEWEDGQEKLQCVDQPRSLQQVLKISYDSLEEQEKTVFLDLSCLLLQNDMKKEDIVDVLVACDLEAELAIGNLMTKSLLKLSEKSKLWMHDQIRDMGRQIVIEENPNYIGKRSRLWDSNDTMRLLHQDKVTKSVRGITLNIKRPPDFTDEMICWLHLQSNPSISKFNRYVAVKFKSLTSGNDPDEDDDFTLHTKWFKSMKNMKLLQMDHAVLQGDFKDMPSELRWLQWKGCPLKSLPSNIPQELRVLDLSNSNIEQLWSSDRSWWGSNKVVGKLEVLNLSYCHNLTTLPDMSGQKHLKKLNLEDCARLTKIHESIGSMSSLVHLNLSGCTSLAEFPRDLTGLIHLKELILSDCSDFRELPTNVGSMKSLNRLILDGTSICELPESLFKLTQLEVLSLNKCFQLKCLPDCLESLTSLKVLSLRGTKLEELPSSIGSLTCLKILNLVDCSSLTVLPESVGKLKALTELFLINSSIKKLPSTVCSLSKLRVLSLGSCRSLLELPKLVGLDSIVELNLDHTPIKVLPDDICFLKSLEKLEVRYSSKYAMNYCSKLEKLPESMGQLSNLTVLSVDGAAITHLPESIGGMEKLSRLNLSSCTNLKSLPNSIGKLSSLRVLMMENTGISCLPETFKELNGLRILKMKKSINDHPTDNPDNPSEFMLPTDFEELINLEEFDAQACRISGEINDNFAKLSNLEILDLGYNSFNKLPSSLKGLQILKKLVLRHCKDIKTLPGLPSTLEELNAADCHALETICDLSNLERLQELQLVNCSKIEDVPGLQCFKSLRRLFMGGCNASAAAVRSRLSKHALKNLDTLSLPGSEIPSWFSQTAVNIAPHRNLAINSVIVAVVVSVDKQQLGHTRADLPSIVDIQASIIRQDRSVFSTALILMGIPSTTEDQLYMCRYKDYHPLVSLLKEADMIQVGLKKCEADKLNGEMKSEAFLGIKLRRWGIHLVFENDDDVNVVDENSKILEDCNKSVSQRLAMFFNSMNQA